MKNAPRVTRIEVFQFEYELKDIGREPTIGLPVYKPGNTLLTSANGVKIETDTGITGLGEAAGDAAILGRSSSAVTVRWRSGPIRRIFRGFGTGSQRGDRSSTILLGAGSTD